MASSLFGLVSICENFVFLWKDWSESHLALKGSMGEGEELEGIVEDFTFFIQPDILFLPSPFV